jgi:acetoin utilization protein AcuB
MTRDVIIVRPADPCALARRIMEGTAVHRLPVLEAGRLVGIVTDGDLARRMPYAPTVEDRRRSQDELLPHVKVSGIMTYAPLTASPFVLLKEAAALMRHRRVNTLPVLEADRLVGILTMGDVLRAGAHVRA